MKQYLILLFLIVNIISYGQTSMDDFTFTMHFKPSFKGQCLVTIKCTQDTNLIELKAFKYKNNDHIILNKQVTLVKGDLNPIGDFLKTYPFQVWPNSMTIPAFKGLLFGDSVSYPAQVLTMLDGIRLTGTYTRSGVVQHYSFSNPFSGTENHKFMDQIFSLLYKSFLTKKVIDYIEDLEDNFWFGLVEKKISDNPLKYRFYGQVFYDFDAEEMTNFINSLPPDKKVFIDLSKFSYFGTMDYPQLGILIKNRNNLFWIKPSKAVLKEFKEIGVPKRNILK